MKLFHGDPRPLFERYDDEEAVSFQSASRASETARRSSPLAQRDYNRGVRDCFIGMGTLYVLGTIALFLICHWLKVRP